MSYIGNQPTSVAFLTDTFSGTGLATAFTMQVAPAGTTSMLVAVTGVVQDPSTYAVVGTTLTFSQAPPAGTNNISVRYLGIPASGVTTTAYRTVTNFTAAAAQTTFITPSYTPGYINVFRNGVYLPTLDYTASNGTTVVLNNAASAGDTITTESFYVSSVLNAIPATAGSVAASYLVPGSITQTYLAPNVAGNGPAFSVYQSTVQSTSSGVWTKIQLQSKYFDTASAFDNTTNFRFQPTVAGYYQFNAVVQLSFFAIAGISIYKNGAGTDYAVSIGASGVLYTTPTQSKLIYLNGSTDYVELYAYQASGGAISTLTVDCAFSGFLARSA